MPIDFSRMPAPQPAHGPVDPIELFQTLRVSDRSINDLWLAQGDALRGWHDRRNAADSAIVLNTGAGKTLVGLLAAQSLVNETHGKVLYACSSLQLVRQTAEKAAGYGLAITTYGQGVQNNQLFDQGLAPCITTYQAIFNGRSRFLAQDIDSIVFDDAHTAGNIIRDQHTLTISRKDLPQVHDALAALFRGYFGELEMDASYVEAQTNSSSRDAWFVPPFVVNANLGEVRRILLSADLTESTSTTFAWQILRDHLDLCTVFVSGTDIVFTPAFIPIRRLSYFQGETRRIYLSATLSAADAFMRDFGVVPDPTTSPTTTAGECERLILMPSFINGRLIRDTGSDDVQAAKEVIAGQKSLVITPSSFRARMWDDVSTDFGGDVADQIDRFKKATGPSCLVLTARFDGVDLPGDTCRLLVIDDLPSGLGRLEQYLANKLGMGRRLRSAVASRVVQSFGRISRGMSDHGVVVITGPRLTTWLATPKNQQLLPPFLQKQLAMGRFISTQAADSAALVDATNQCLQRDGNWLQYYESTMSSVNPLANPFEETSEDLRIATIEQEFGSAIWERRYLEAIQVFESSLNDTFKVSKPTGAWHALWLGYAYEKFGQPDQAQRYYGRSYRAEKNIPPPIEIIRRRPTQSASPQVTQVVELLTTSGTLRIPTHFDADLQALAGGTTRQVEAALEALGSYLGLECSRPDNEHGTGPDVLWHLPDAPALCIEAKTSKESDGVYRKDELGQLRDHQRWVDGQALGVTAIIPTFVGPLVAASPESNPDPEMLVVELEEFQGLGVRLRAALEDIARQGSMADVVDVCSKILAERRLRWPFALEDLRSSRLVDVPSQPSN